MAERRWLSRSRSCTISSSRSPRRRRDSIRPGLPVVREIVFVAGEVSGDLHAAGVARELVARKAPYKLVGIGGDRMREAGGELIEHSAHLAVMGFVEVIGTLRRHWSLLSDLKVRFRSGNVAAVVLFDYPDFNMLVASAAKNAGVPVIYYITPQVWAWRASESS